MSNDENSTEKRQTATGENRNALPSRPATFGGRAQLETFVESARPASLVAPRAGFVPVLN